MFHVRYCHGKCLNRSDILGCLVMVVDEQGNLYSAAVIMSNEHIKCLDIHFLYDLYYMRFEYWPSGRSMV